MSIKLAERVLVLRDEVLETAEYSDREPPASEVFDAIVRGVASYGETSPGIDLTLHDALSRRLAWGDREADVLAETDQMCDRLLKAATRAFRDPVEEMLVAEMSCEVGAAAARIVAMASVGRAGRERAARMREEMSARRLKEALSRQRQELDRLEQAMVGVSKKPGGGPLDW